MLFSKKNVLNKLVSLLLTVIGSRALK